MAALLIGVYALVGRIEFPVGAGYVVPTQLILVPMLLMLPPAVVPAAVGAGMVSGNAVDWALGRVPPRRVLSAVPDAWHAVGPAAVLLAGRVAPDRLRRAAPARAAFAAGCMLDLASSLVRMRLAGVVPDLRVQMRVIGLVWAVDASLAPLGLLAAIAARSERPGDPVRRCRWCSCCGCWPAIAASGSTRPIIACKLVEHERVRLQSAVRRLGDAFAAKLELEGLLEILLHGSIEALDAAAGRWSWPGVGRR